MVLKIYCQFFQDKCNKITQLQYRINLIVFMYDLHTKTNKTDSGHATEYIHKNTLTFAQVIRGTQIYHYNIIPGIRDSNTTQITNKTSKPNKSHQATSFLPPQRIM